MAGPETGPKGEDADQSKFVCPVCGKEHWALEGLCGEPSKEEID